MGRPGFISANREQGRGTSLVRAYIRMAAAVLLLAGLAVAGPYDTWGKYKTLTINTTNTSGGANVSTTQTNFPVLVRLLASNADDVLGEALSNGADVRFASSDGSTALSYQIEYWSSTEADIWVLVPSVAGNSTTDIRLYWKKSGQSDASSGSSVFATSNSFEGVWHLGETGNTTADGYKDASGNAAHATGSNFSSGNEAAAAVGKGQTFANASSRKITVKASAEPNFDITGAITVSAWINITSWTTAWQAILTKGDGAWRLHRNNGTGTLQFACTGLTTNASISGSTTLSTGTWYYATGVYDGSNLRMYLNGTSDATALGATGSISNDSYNVMIGENEQATGRYFNGMIDEARVESVARSADWIKLSYQTQKSGATCISYGATLTPGLTYYWNRSSDISTGDVTKAFNWSINTDGTGPRPISATDDDFTSDSKASAWSTIDVDTYGDTQSPYYSLTDNADQLTLRGAGGDVYLSGNQFVGMYRSDITGDFDVSVKILSQTNTDVWAKTGIMMANDPTTLTSGGFAYVAVTPGNGFTFQYDSSGTVGQVNGFVTAGSTAYPCWLRLTKSGTSVRAYYKTSTNADWTQIGGARTPQSTNTNSKIVLFVCSHSGSLSTVVFDDFQGGTTLSASNLNLSFNGTGSNKSADAVLSSNLSAASLDLTNYTGTLDFGSKTLTINSGNAVFGNGMSVTQGTGTLAFTAGSGTQVLTPPSGATLPAISSTGASTLQLSTNALSCASYTQNAGVLDFNGEDVATIGDFTLTNGTSSSFSNLTGRTLTIGGNASFTGSAGNLVNLNSGGWTITTTGTLTADYANIAYSNASAGSQGVATHSYKGKSNSNWLFSIPAALSNLTRSVRLNFNTTSSGANVSGSVANFPLFVRFTSSNMNFSATSDSGNDLIFVDKDGTPLYHQVVEWDKANQTGKAWVRVPQVDGNSTADYITLYYGCDSCTTNSYARSDSVFTVFKSVFHLNAPEAKAYDATTLANHGTFVSNLPNLANGGIVSKNAAVFDGGANSYIDVPNESNYDLTTNISLWAWIKVNTFNTAYQAILTKGNNTFRLTRHNTGNDLFFACTKSSSTFQLGGSANVNDGNWHHVVATYAGDSLRLYVDGARDGLATSLTGSIDVNNTDVYIGENAGLTGTVFNGGISEVRIGNTATALSADFIKLSYETQKASSAFLTSHTTASFQSTKVFKLNTTSSGANVSGDVTNFPLLLRITGSTLIDGVQGTGTNAPPDIRFLDNDGVTWLDYQVERWDRTLDSAEVWVRVPTIEGNYAGHTITMYYKQASGVTVVDGQCASCVFQTSNNFVGDWHLNTSGTTARPDASGNGYNLTTNNYTGSELKGGVIAGADSLNGSNQYLSLGSGTSDFSGGFTYTGWVYEASTASWARLYDFGAGQAIDNIWSGRNSTTTDWTAEVYNNTSAGGYTTATGALGTGSWAHYAVTVNGTAVNMYKNGSLVKSRTSSQSARVVARANSYFGKSNWADAYFQGKFDELAIANTPRDSNWVKLLYQNQRRDAAPLFNPSPADFQYTQKYAFNTTKTGANVMTDQTDFPLLVRVTGSAIVDAVQNNAPDIRFLDGDGTTWLNYQVERWDKTLDSAEVWVLVPKVDGNSDHDFVTLYYAQAAGTTVPDGQCATCVFSSSNGFSGVWHLDSTATGVGTSSVYRDASTNANHGVDSVAATGKAGAIGKGQQFANANDRINVGTYNPSNTNLTLSAWINWAGNNTSPFQELFCKRNTWGTSTMRWQLYRDSTDQKIRLRTTSQSTSFDNDIPSTNTWIHLAVTTVNGSTARLYLNGAQAGADKSFTWDTATAAMVRLGNVEGSEYFNGYMDEARIDNVIRSSDWIKLNYETQRRSGNLFWNGRVGPNNKATLTATATSSSNINLSWSSTVSDSSNADSVGIWVKYAAYPDSANASGATFVAKLAKTDTSYSYPATYPTTYYFGLAVRNTSGKWSPITASSSDTATLVGAGATMPDTVYVDSAAGNNSNTCSAAQNPATPKLTVSNALTCGGSASDTLVVRVLPGTYTADTTYTITGKPSVVTSFDSRTRAVLAGYNTSTDNAVTYGYAVGLNTGMTLRNMDVKPSATSDKHIGIYVRYDADSVVITGNRVYLNGSYAFDTSVAVQASNNVGTLIANNLLYKANKKGVQVKATSKINIMNNVIWGPGSASSQGIGLGATPASPNPGITITNNILVNWDYGMKAAAANAFGTVSNNLFYLVTSGREDTLITDAANRVIKDPLFANTTIGNPNAFKLLPGSPGVDAGTATISTTANAWARTAPTDHFGTSRPLGSAPDIGLYEGTGYTPNPSGEFDSLTVSSTSTTVTVQNAKWKLVWDQARGAGITQFYDKVTNSANLVATNSLLFDAKIASYTASSQTGAGPVLSLVESSRARAIVRQRLPVSASLDLNIYYSVYPSGHVYIESELSNLAASGTAAGSVDYTLKVGTSTAAYTSAGTKNGFGYLTTSSRGALIAVTRDLDGGASGSETWATSTAASGSPGTVVFNTASLATLSQNTVRRHDFLLYVGDASLTFDKAAVLNADAYNPSALSMSAGSLLGERSWQESLQGHWTLDEGAGATARDKSVFTQNNATLGGANYKWVSGKAGAGLYLTATDSAYVPSASVLNPGNGFTVMFWLKPDFAGMGDTALIVSKGLSNANGWYCRKVTSVNKVQFTMGAATVTSPTLTDGAWTHIAVVADAGGNKQLEMYVNGVQSAASTASAVATSNTANVVFGYASGSIANAKFKGTLDDIRIYGREVPGSDIQSIHAFGFSSKYGHYSLRADNNNRIVALINSGAAQTRVQPAFFISNWYGPRNPKYVFLNGSKLTPNTDYVVDSTNSSTYGGYLTLQLNKVLTDADQTLFIDDDDSTGFMGTATAMKSLTITATANDKIAIKNFADTVFGGSTSGQWYMELGLKGWTTPTGSASMSYDSSFGEIKAWKAAAVSPNLAVSSAYQMVGFSYKTGRALTYMKLDASTNEIFTAGQGYLSPATNTYTLVDSSSTRLSLTLSADSLTGTAGSGAVTKRFTFYPTGRVFVSYQVRNLTGNMTAPRVDLNPRYDNLNPQAAWSATTARNNARHAFINGDLNFHSIGLSMLSIKNATSTYTTGAAMLGSFNAGGVYTAGNDQYMGQFNMPTSLWTSANKPITVNFMMDFSKNYKDSATADSLLKDTQNPAVITALTGTRVTNDALDFNADNFAEADGAYTYAASSGIASFKFVNSVTSFYPAFRISSWTQGTLPEFVVLDNQVLTKGYQYNAYLNVASNEVVMQFNKILSPGTHVFFISHKSGLAVKLNRFEAKGGNGVDSLSWTTESEFENLGFFVWRRALPAGAAGNEAAAAAAKAGADAASGEGQASAGGAARVTLDSGNTPDTLPSASLNLQDLERLGYVRITPKLLPGAPGGSSATTRDYHFVDRTAAYDGAYEYLLEAVDFNNGSVFYGPRAAHPGNPLNTEILPNYPNPFNPTTTLRFSLREKLKVSLIIYDARGKVVRTLVRPEKPLAAGKYSVIWDARNEAGLEAPSGQYFYRFVAGRYVKSRKMLLIK